MKRFTLTVLVLCFVNYGFSQVGWQPGALLPLDYHDWSKREMRALEYTGSPYVEDDFVHGSINDEAGNSRYAFLRYNAIEEIVEIKIPNSDQQEIKVLPKIRNLSYSLNDYKYVFDSFITNEGKTLEGYFIEYYKGDSLGLYGNPFPKLSESQRAGRKKPDAHLSVEVDYYVRKADGTLHYLKLKEKEFKTLLPNSAQLDHYMAVNKLKTPQDFAKLLSWFENLNL